MKKINSLNIFIGIGLVIIVLISGWLFFSDKIEKPGFQEEIETYQENIKNNVVLVIDDSQDLFQLFEVDFEEGMTAFDLLKNQTEELGLSLMTKTYDIGVFVEAIGEKENGQDGKYWLYYINGESPMIASDKIEIKPGDKVEFKFEESIF
jgi:hypothetical protein